MSPSPQLPYDLCEGDFFGLEDPQDEILLSELAVDWDLEARLRHRPSITGSATATLDGVVKQLHEENLSELLESTDIEELPTLLCLEKVYQDHKLPREQVEELDRSRAGATLSPYDRFRSRQNRLTVTDLVQPGWCELQFQYGLETLKPKHRTPAMKKGHELHDALEKEVHAVVKVTLDPDIKEERLALRLLNMFQGLEELQTSGITRELPVFGYLDQTFISGIIDQLQFKTRADERTRAERLMQNYFGRSESKAADLVLSDHKSRVSRSEPSQTQENQAKLQLMVYWQLFKSMTLLKLEIVAAIDQLDPEQELSEMFKTQALRTIDTDDASPDVLQAMSTNTLLSYWQLAQNRLERIVLQLSRSLEISYIHQSSGEHISTKSFEMDEAWAAQETASILAWWHGHRDPRGVPVEEANKCNYCEYAEGCSWRLEQIRLAIERKRAQTHGGK